MNEIAGIDQHAADSHWHLRLHEAEVAMRGHHPRCEVVEAHLAHGVHIAHAAVSNQPYRAETHRYGCQAVAEVAAVLGLGAKVLERQHHGLGRCFDSLEHLEARFAVVDPTVRGRIQSGGDGVSDHHAHLREHAANVPAHEAVGVAAYVEVLDCVGDGGGVNLPEGVQLGVVQWFLHVRISVKVNQSVGLSVYQ